MNLGEHSLFASVMEAHRAMLESSPLGGLLPGEKVADLFCGAGGWGEGARDLSVAVDFAVNHWKVAIDTHAINNPGCRHEQGDAWRVRPRDVIGGATLGVLFASAACTTHSKARGSAPVSKRVHMLGWCIARWMREASPRVVLIENVPEWEDWGPLVEKRHKNGRLVRDEQGRIVRVHCPKRKGQHFRRWWRQCERLGYVMEKRVLDAPDYGSPSRRRRLFIIARRDGMPIVWPEATHGAQPVGESGRAEARQRSTGGHPVADVLDSGEGDRRGDEDRPRRHPQRHGRRAAYVEQVAGTGANGLKPYRTAADVIDWSDLGRSIFDRKQPLKPKSLGRIAHGIGKHVLRDPAPFILNVTYGDGGWSVPVYPIDGPTPTQTTRQDLAVCTPIMSTTGYGERAGQAPRVHSVLDQLGTCVDGLKQAVVMPVVAPQNSGVFGQRPDAPGPTIPTHGHQAVISPVLMGAGGSEYAAKPTRVDVSHNTVKCDTRSALVAPVSVELYGTARSGRRVDEPGGAVMSQGNHSGVAFPLCAQYYGNSATLHRPDQPLGACVTLDRHASVIPVLTDAELALSRGRKVAAFLREHLGDLVPIDPENGLAYVELDGVRRYFIDILFRMLRVRELAAAMGFPADYQWPRTRKGTINQRQSVKLIGNAVSADQSRALVAAVLPRMRGPRVGRVAA